MKKSLSPSPRLTATAIGLATIGLAWSVAAADEWKKSLEQALRAKYEITKTGMDRVRITQPGTVFELRQDGVSGDPSGDLSYLDNNIVDGKIAQRSGFMALVQGKERSRALDKGQRMYLYDIDVKDDEVRYFLITTETFEFIERTKSGGKGGGSKQTRYKALLKFKFPKPTLATMDADAVKKVVDEVVAPQGEVAEASTKTIKLGQTRAEVESILGKPANIIDLGAKVTYVYKDMKIIFVDGKVADVQ